MSIFINFLGLTQFKYSKSKPKYRLSVTFFISARSFSVLFRLFYRPANNQQFLYTILQEFSSQCAHFLWENHQLLWHHLKTLLQVKAWLQNHFRCLGFFKYNYYKFSLIGHLIRHGVVHDMVICLQLTAMHYLLWLLSLNQALIVSEACYSIVVYIADTKKPNMIYSRPNVWLYNELDDHKVIQQNKKQSAGFLA